MFSKPRVIRVSVLLRATALAVALVSVPLLLVRSADAAGTFTTSDSTVIVNFMTTNSQAQFWDFIFSGDVPLSATCPSGGIFSTQVTGPDDIACVFGAAPVPGQVTVTLTSPWSCDTPIENQVSVDGSTYLTEPAITCTTPTTIAGGTTTTVAGGTTTTIAGGTTTTVAGGTTTSSTTSSTSTTTSSTTTTTAPASTTTTSTIPISVTSLPPGPCHCQRLVVAIAPNGVSNSQGPVQSTGAKVNRVILKMRWIMNCTQGAGHCRSTVSVDGPDGSSTRLHTASPIVSAGGGTHGVKEGAPIRGSSFTCSGPCAATSTGWLYVQADFGSPLAGKTFHFLFHTDCNGRRLVQDIKLVYRSNGRLNQQASSLGEGKSG